MLDKIERLRQESDSGKRRSIAMFLTIILFLIIVFVWFTTLNISNFSREKESQVSDTPSPFANLKNILIDFKDETKESIESIKDLL